MPPTKTFQLKLTPDFREELEAAAERDGFGRGQLGTWMKWRLAQTAQETLNTPGVFGFLALTEIEWHGLSNLLNWYGTTADGRRQTATGRTARSVLKKLHDAAG